MKTRGVGKPVQVRHGKMHQGSSVTYQLEKVLCGKAKCAKLHGPYWYAYWTSSGRVQTMYIGKRFLSVDDKLRERRAKLREQ